LRNRERVHATWRRRHTSVGTDTGVWLVTMGIACSGHNRVTVSHTNWELGRDIATSTGAAFRNRLQTPARTRTSGRLSAGRPGTGQH